MEPTQCIRIACIKIWSRKSTQCIKIADASIKIWNRLNVLRNAMHVLRFGVESRNPSQCIRIVNACIKIRSQCIKVGDACIRKLNSLFSALCDIFRHCEIFSKKVQKFMAGPPARIIITPAENYYGCGYFFTRLDIDMT